MSDDAIHYAFSRCISRPGEKLQRDRLIDARVFVKILNLDEIRAVVNRNGRPCASMTLLLASLLWPHPRLFPLDFDLSVMTPAPPTFYALDFDTRRLPPPPGDSYGFNVLFALQVESDEMLAVQLADFCFAIVAHIQTVSTGIELWDLTFRVDRNRVLGTLQFETRSGHEKNSSRCLLLYEQSLHFKSHYGTRRVLP